MPKSDSIFSEHEQHFSVLTAEITDKLNIIQGHAITGDSVAGPCTEVDRLMTEADELLEQMELEAQQQQAGSRETLTNRVRSYSAEQRRLQADYRALRHRVSRTELLGGDGGADGTERLRDNTELMERTGNKLDEGYRLCLESEAVGAEVLSDLSGQRETLTRSRSKLRDTDSELSRSSRLLTGMMHRAVQNRVVLILLAVVLLVVLLYALYRLVAS